jgi:Superinfection immunity protein
MDLSCPMMSERTQGVVVKFGKAGKLLAFEISIAALFGALEGAAWGRGSGGQVLVGLTALFALFLYLLPAYIAACRNHHNYLAILMLNILLGATVVVWIAALIWACTAVREQQNTTVIVHNTPSAPRGLI